MSTQIASRQSQFPVHAIVVCAVASLLLGVGLYVMPIKAVLDDVLHALLFSPALINCMALAGVVFCLCALSKVDGRVFPQAERCFVVGLVSALGLLCVSLILSLIFARAPDLGVYRSLMAQGYLNATPTDGGVIEKILDSRRPQAVFKRTDCQALVHATPQDSKFRLTVNDRVVNSASSPDMCGYGANVMRWSYLG